MNPNALRNSVYDCLLSLSTDEGINASSKDEVYGCIFGRDTALTILKILKVHSKNPNPELLKISRRALLTLIALQGKNTNLESGEEPGKFIHEFRKDKYEHLVNKTKPWYIYEDGKLRNYDSVDSTPLGLIAIYKYWQLTSDTEFLNTVLPGVEAGLNWIANLGDKDNDYLIEYDYPSTRNHGGLLVQSWTDSHESMLKPDGKMPKYPIAPVEVQAFAWLAMLLWARFYSQHSPALSERLTDYAQKIKQKFNQEFIFKNRNYYFAAQALDGNKEPIQTITGNPLLCLWACFQNNGQIECIIDQKYINDIVERAFQSDLFDADAGIRTMSNQSKTFNPNQNSYHNGSFWPILNGLAHEGLKKWSFGDKADLLKQASLKAIYHFGTPIELYIKDQNGNFLEYRSHSGTYGCRRQAWSAAAFLDLLTD